MLLMMGYVIIDPKGPERLRRVLADRKPMVIGIERSPDEAVEEEIAEMTGEAVGILLSKMLASYAKDGRSRAQGLFEGIKENVGYDERVVREYAEDAGAEVVPMESTIERHGFVSEMHKRAMALVGVKERAQELGFDEGQFQRLIDTTYYNESIILRSLMLDPPSRKRSEVMAKKVMAKKCDATVTGFAHTVDSPGTLYRLLHSHSPERIPLDSADKL
jgi:hypothetical protein